MAMPKPAFRDKERLFRYQEERKEDRRNNYEITKTGLS